MYRMRCWPWPSSATLPAPSITIFGPVSLKILAVSVSLIVTGSGPHANVITPPRATAATNAALVQLAAVPSPTTVVGVELSSGAASAGIAQWPSGLPAGGPSAGLASGLSTSTPSSPPHAARPSNTGSTWREIPMVGLYHPLRSRSSTPRRPSSVSSQRCGAGSSAVYSERLSMARASAVAVAVATSSGSAIA